MNDRDTDVELHELERMGSAGTDLVAVALAKVNGNDVEPLLVTLDAGKFQVEAEVVLPLGINLRAIFGGLQFGSLPVATRIRIFRLVVERATEKYLGDAA